ncbi:hypothetical protein N7470_000859 [Penicillium chermesinum]|nr:hypothetical protein N7470_000859 [Penicillium chermesinum]
MPVKIIKDVSEASLDVVLVPGLKIADKPEWTSAKSALFWPERLLPQKAPKARILAFEYDDDLTVDAFWNERNGFHSTSDELVDDLTEARSGDKAKRPIVFVAHCLGGVVLQSALLRANKNESNKKLVEKVASILLLGTPQYTPDNLQTAKKFFQLVGKEIPSDSNLKTLSAHILKVSQEFAQLREANSINVETFYENAPVEIHGKKLYIVDVSEAKLPGDSPDPKVLKGNHHEIARFEDENKDFRTVSRSIARVIENLPKQDAKGGWHEHLFCRKQFWLPDWTE